MPCAIGANGRRGPQFIRIGVSSDRLSRRQRADLVPGWPRGQLWQRVTCGLGAFGELERRGVNCVGE